MESHSTQSMYVYSLLDEIRFQRSQLSLSGGGEKQTIFRLTLSAKVVICYFHFVTFERIVCKVRNQRYKTNFAQDIRLKAMNEGEWTEKNPNRMKKTTAIIKYTTTISIAIIRQLKIFSK